MTKVLIVDDDDRIRAGMVGLARSQGYLTVEASDGSEALKKAAREDPSVILLDLRMPGMDGMETLRQLRDRDPTLPVIVVTGYGEVDDAVQAMKNGAYDFLTKPPEMERLLASVERAAEKREMERRLKRLDSSLGSTLEWMLGKGPGMKKVIDQIRQVAPSEMAVIIQGETGSGKSLVARAIHMASNRAERAMITVDMGTLPETLVESQIFGHEKGAFTGADRARTGRFQEASGGTLFIDELQNMPETVQRKILLAVEQKEIYPVGSSRPRSIDVRIIGATNADLRREVDSGRFREDLFFRLGEFIIQVPPLRDRVEEIPDLALKFVEEAARQFCKPDWGIDPGAEEVLRRHRWPGNVRELKNVIRKAALISQDGLVRTEDLDISDSGPPDVAPDMGWPCTEGYVEGESLREFMARVVKEAETKVITAALRKALGNKSRVAAALQMDYSTLHRKIREYNLKV